MTETATVWVCTNCQTSYDPGPGKVCPTCGRPDHYGQGVTPNMPKITVHGGPSNADAELTGDGSGQALPDYDEANQEEREWAGNSSSTSSASSEKTPEQTETSRPEPAPTTESPSGQDQTESSSASPTGGSGPETPKEYAAKGEWVAFVEANGWPAELGDPAGYTKADLIAWWQTAPPAENT